MSDSILRDEHTSHTFRRVLAFCGRTIDDVINCPYARGEVMGYFKLTRHIARQGEIVELESQWNPTGQLGKRL